MITRREFTKLGFGAAAIAAGTQVVTSTQGKASVSPAVVPPNKMSDSQTKMDDKTLFIKIQAQLEKADEERLAQNWEKANELLLQALNVLGGRYFHPAIGADDSGLKLIAANTLHREGKLENAVLMRRRILFGRLESLRRKMADNLPAMDDKTLFIEIQARLEKADIEIKAQNWKAANELLLQAVAELGTRYRSFNTSDTSNLRFIAATNLEVEGKLDEAARERRGVIAERLEIFRRKIR